MFAGMPAEGATVPTYQYVCTVCGHRFDAVQSFSDEALTECPECSGRLRKLFSAVGIVFKGSGFYHTDNRTSSNGGRKSSTASSSSKSDNGSASSSAQSSAKGDGASASSSSSASTGTSSGTSSGGSGTTSAAKAS